MGKSHAQHQREYRECLKEKNAEMSKIRSRQKESKEKPWRKLRNMRTAKQKIDWEKESKKSQ